MIGRVVITSDGLFAAVTDYGNIICKWEQGGHDFREFLYNMSEEQFSGDLFRFNAGKLPKEQCDEIAINIFEKLKPFLFEEVEANDKTMVVWPPNYNY